MKQFLKEIAGLTVLMLVVSALALVSIVAIFIYLIGNLGVYLRDTRSIELGMYLLDKLDVLINGSGQPIKRAERL